MVAKWEDLSNLIHFISILCLPVSCRQLSVSTSSKFFAGSDQAVPLCDAFNQGRKEVQHTDMACIQNYYVVFKFVACAFMPPADVDALSDDDAQRLVRPVEGLSDDDVTTSPALPLRPKQKRKFLEANAVKLHATRLRAAVDSNCKCRSNVACSGPWRSDPEAFEELLQFRLQIHQLPKLEADREVALFQLETCFPSVVSCFSFGFDA